MPIPQRLLVLSPHMDDAVLDCFDHIQSWKKQYKVHLITLFSTFPWRQLPLPDTAFEYMRQSNYSDAKKFSEQRHYEDDMAMRQLGVNFDRFELPDASFRKYEDRGQYITFQSIFSGRIKPDDKPLLNHVLKLLTDYGAYDKVVCPLGLGNHIDHLVTKKAAEMIFPKGKRWYYRDYPYGIRRRRFKDLWLRIREESRMVMSSNKQSAIQCYTSQIKQLFPKMVYYDEVIYR